MGSMLGTLPKSTTDLAEGRNRDFGSSSSVQPFSPLRHDYQIFDKLYMVTYEQNLIK
jgi:hypothetical protein